MLCRVFRWRRRARWCRRSWRLCLMEHREYQKISFWVVAVAIKNCEYRAEVFDTSCRSGALMTRMVWIPAVVFFAYEVSFCASTAYGSLLSRSVFIDAGIGVSGWELNWNYHGLVQVKDDSGDSRRWFCLPRRQDLTPSQAFNSLFMNMLSIKTFREAACSFCSSFIISCSMVREGWLW